MMSSLNFTTKIAQIAKQGSLDLLRPLPSVFVMIGGQNQLIPKRSPAYFTEVPPHLAGSGCRDLSHLQFFCKPTSFSILHLLKKAMCSSLMHFSPFLSLLPCLLSPTASVGKLLHAPVTKNI